MRASPSRFALTIAAILCLLVERTVALDAFGAPGALLGTLLRVFLSVYTFVHYRLFRLSIHLFEPAAPVWWDWLIVLLGLAPYVLADVLLGGTRADRAALKRPAG